MILIAIHGFRTLLKPGVWSLSEKVMQLLRTDGTYSHPKLIKLGYKHILYTTKHGIRGDKDEYEPTLQLILEAIRMNNGPIIILGHSLGAFAASALAKVLVEQGIFIDMLIQIDAMPLFTESLVFTEKWVETILESDDFTAVDKLLEKNILSEHRARISSASNVLISQIQNLADSIEYEKIRPELIQSRKIRPYLHQHVFNTKQVGKHYYYYVQSDAITIIDKLIHIGTGFSTGPLRSTNENIINVAISKTHFLIDDDLSIYDQCLADLGVDAKLADLKLSSKISKKKQQAEETLLFTKQKSTKILSTLKNRSTAENIAYVKQHISYLLKNTRQQHNKSP